MGHFILATWQNYQIERGNTFREGCVLGGQPRLHINGLGTSD